MKKLVAGIAAQMARPPSVQTCCWKWPELQNGFYSNKPLDKAPLSQQKEFRAIHNAVVQAAIQIGQLTFEDKGWEKRDEPDDTIQTSNIHWQF